MRASMAGEEDSAPPTRFPWEGPRPRGPRGKSDTGACAQPTARPNGQVLLRTPTGWEGRRPRRPQEFRAQRTVPLPQGPSGGSASSRSGKTSGAEDCAPPGHRPTVGILRHWPAREGPRPRGPQENADPGARAEPAARLKRPVPLRAPTGRERPRPRGPLKCACNELLIPSRCAGHPARCSRKRLQNTFPDTNRQP
jgi:hypothetical protein